MNMNDMICGFRMKRSVRLEELSGVLYELQHEKTGLKLVWLQRDDENKTFGIAFTTLPWNDTGVFHILEHSVLCGSEKFPVKEPFVELLKNSMNTFLNAMTFPDKTVYPVSSCNAIDFMNLVRVYLDAVFCPSIYHKPEIFRQEGWHYELDETGSAAYKGVVFNEMKGAFADADEFMENEMNRAMFPDNCYRYVSGGDPAKIPDLSYEEFLDGHRKYYSPSNAYVFLDGDLELEPVLRLLDEDYLCHFERTERIAPPQLQQAVDGGIREVAYELAPDEEEAGHVRLNWGNVIGRFDEREKLVGMQILSEYLCGSNQAPLTRALLSRELAEDVTLSLRDGVLQNYSCLEVRNLKAENIETVRALVRETLEEQIAGGLDREQLEAIISNIEFRARERDYGTYPRGLIYGLTIMESWLYGGAPEALLEVGNLFDTLRARMQEGWFEQLLRDQLLENPHSCQIVMMPSRTAGDERRLAEQQRLQAETAAWTEADRTLMQERQQRLIAWQESEDTPEQLATLPHLQLEDIEDAPVRLPLEVSESAGIPVLLHHQSTGGIAYLKLYFDADFCNEEQLSQLAFLTGLLGETRTSAHTAEELITMDRLLCGSTRYHLEVYGRRTGCLRKFCVSMSVLESKLEPALRMVAEILTDSQLDEEQTAFEVVKQGRQQLMEQITMSGATAAIGRVAAQNYDTGVAGEYISGFEYYQWIKAQENNWDWQTLSGQLRSLLRQLVATRNMTLSITGDAEKLMEPTARLLKELLPVGEAQPEVCRLQPWGFRREGIAVPGDVSFAVQGGNFKNSGAEYNGAMQAAGRIISLSYLWNMIRVQGGAYGCGFHVRTNGMVDCYSYRDPNAANSLAVYPTCGEFLKQFCEQNPDFTGFIIGAISDSSPLMTARIKGNLADTHYWQGIDWELRCRRRKELLGITKEQVLEMAELFGETLKNGGVCVVGGRKQLEACDLDTILSV